MAAALAGNGIAALVVFTLRNRLVSQAITSAHTPFAWKASDTASGPRLTVHRIREITSMSRSSSELGLLKVALTGGMLVASSYVSEYMFAGVIDESGRNASAICGALILSLPLFWEALADLYHGRLHMNELVCLALLAAFVQGEYQIAGVVAFFMLTTLALEKRTAKGAEAAITALVRLTPSKARRLRHGCEEEVAAAHDLRADDLCRVRPGENFPADGTLVSGMTIVNQASITGESLPVDKGPGDVVFAGTQNMTALVDFKVTRVGIDSTIGKVKSLIAAAEGSKLPLSRMVDKYVGYYTPTILMIAALTWFLTGDIKRVIAVLIMAVPDDLIVAVPAAALAAVSAAARLGILIKDVNHLELAARIKTVVFDKTGTLTEGRLAVAKMQNSSGVDLAELLTIAASVERHSNHPVALALQRLAADVGVVLAECSDSREWHGLGVMARIHGQECFVGREQWLRKEGIVTAPLPAGLRAPDNDTLSLIWVARDHQLLGWIGLEDAVRATSATAVQQLAELGISDCWMVTGDHEGVAREVASRVGLRDIKAGCLPEDKEALVNDLKSNGRTVAFVGDGVNDAPALACGDIGIAMGGMGSDIAMESASITLMNNDLRRIPFLIALARKADRIMKQNLAFGLFFIISGVYLAIIGVVTPIYAACLHGVSFLYVFFNSARLVRVGEGSGHPEQAGHDGNNLAGNRL